MRTTSTTNPLTVEYPPRRSVSLGPVLPLGEVPSPTPRQCGGGYTLGSPESPPLMSLVNRVFWVRPEDTDGSPSRVPWTPRRVRRTELRSRKGTRTLQGRVFPLLFRCMLHLFPLHRGTPWRETQRRERHSEIERREREKRETESRERDREERGREEREERQR